MIFNPKNIVRLSDDGIAIRFSKTGSRKYMNELFNRYGILVYGVCLKHLKNAENSKDATLQIFEKLINTLENHDIKNFKSWLFDVTRNYCLMLLGKRDMTNPISNLSIAIINNLQEGDKIIAIEKEVEILQEALKQLNPEQKQCIELFYFDKQSYREIAIVTRFELQKVKHYIQIGKRNLQQTILPLLNDQL